MEGHQALDRTAVQPFHVLMIAASPFPLPQGSQVLVTGLSETLQRRGHNVTIVTYPMGASYPLPPHVPLRRAAAVPFYRRLDPGPSFWKPLQDLLLAREVLAQIRTSPPDLLHTHNMEGLLIGLWIRRKTGLPLVYHMHNLMEPELPAYFRFRALRWAGQVLGGWVDGNLPRRAQACIVLTKQAVAPLQRLGVPPARIHMIPPGMHLPEESPPPTEARQRRGPGTSPLVLYSGNLDRYQDLGFLLRAFQRVLQIQPQARLVLATHRGIAKGRVQALQHKLGTGGQLQVLSNWQEMQDLIVACDVAVSPRQVCWGFPIKILNYMAAGRPIVAAAGSAQGLRHMETGWVVPNGDEAAFAQAILTLLQDRATAEQLGRAARQEIRQHYSWTACAAAVERIYATLLSSPRSPF